MLAFYVALRNARKMIVPDHNDVNTMIVPDHNDVNTRTGRGVERFARVHRFLPVHC